MNVPRLGQPEQDGPQEQAAEEGQRLAVEAADQERGRPLDVVLWAKDGCNTFRVSSRSQRLQQRPVGQRQRVRPEHVARDGEAAKNAEPVENSRCGHEARTGPTTRACRPMRHRTRPHARPMPALFRPRPAAATVARARSVRFGDAEEVDAEPCPAQPLHRVQQRDRPHKRRCRHLPKEDREKKARGSVRASSCRQLQLSGNAGGARYIGGGSGGSMVAVAATRHGTSHASLDSGLPSPESPGPGPVPLL